MRDEEDERVFFDRRVAIAEFAGVFDFHRQVREFLEQVLSDQRRVPTGAASRDHNLVHRPQFRQGHVQSAKFRGGFVMIEAAARRVFDRARLLENFLEHVMRELAPLSCFRAEFDLADLDRRRA